MSNFERKEYSIGIGTPFCHETQYVFSKQAQPISHDLILPWRRIVSTSSKKRQAQLKPVSSLLFRTCFYAVQVALAVQYLHDNNIVYREYLNYYLVLNLKM